MLSVTFRGFDRVVKTLEQRAASTPKRCSVLVGYSMYYAVYVHENMAAHHDNGQAQFLRQPAYEIAHNMRGTINTIYRVSGSLPTALLVAGRMLLAASQPLVPVRTGALKASGYVKMEKQW